MKKKRNYKEEYQYIKKGLMKVRIQAIVLLGGKCSNPYGIDHTFFETNPYYPLTIQIDHINGGGCKEIKMINSIGVCRKIIKNPTKAKKEYQLLCPNCNWIKKFMNNEHPHSHYIKKSSYSNLKEAF
jgi:hypothetical protein